jgi:hypothetical protein
MTGSELRYIRRTERLRSFCSAARRAGTSPAIAALMQMQYSRAYRSPAEAGVRYHESRSAAFNADAPSCGLLPRTSILRRYMSLSDCHCPGTSPLSSSVAAPLKSPDISFSLARKKRRLKPNESNMLDQILLFKKGSQEVCNSIHHSDRFAFPIVIRASLRRISILNINPIKRAKRAKRAKRERYVAAGEGYCKYLSFDNIDSNIGLNQR